MWRDTVGGFRHSVWPITPIDSIQPFGFGSFDQSFDGGFANVKQPCNLSQRFTTSNGFNRRSPILRSQAERFDSCSGSFKKTNFQITLF